MIKFKDIKNGDLIVLKNSRDIIGTIIGVSDSPGKFVFYYPKSEDLGRPQKANYGKLSKNFDIIKSGKKEEKKSRKSFSIRTYIRKRLEMIWQ